MLYFVSVRVASGKGEATRQAEISYGHGYREFFVVETLFASASKGGEEEGRVLLMKKMNAKSGRRNVGRGVRETSLQNRVQRVVFERRIVVVDVSADCLFIKQMTISFQIGNSASILLKNRFVIRFSEVHVDEFHDSLNEISLKFFYYWSNNFRRSRGTEEDEARIRAEAENRKSNNCRKIKRRKRIVDFPKFVVLFLLIFNVASVIVCDVDSNRDERSFLLSLNLVVGDDVVVEELEFFATRAVFVQIDISFCCVVILLLLLLLLLTTTSRENFR